MRMRELEGKLVETPVIAAVKSDDGLHKALESELGVLFVLYGDILNISEIVGKIHSAGKAAFVHVDLVAGLSSREIAVDFIRKNTSAHGIISTKQPLLRHAKTHGLLTVQRFFLLDSIALDNIQKQMAQDAADLVEVLPGLMPKIIRRIADTAKKPIIAGGLISDKEDIVHALAAGAMAVSSTNPETWFL